ncbi:MAG: hypothetical protein CL878_06780, partial [Dehalococcoidia bacterium]|nr:hypothetical protein [Dehalococcoidia bacterium]
IAEQIKSIAREHDIPLIENKPLAQTLFKTVDLGMFVPPALYKAVAELLAIVFRLRPTQAPGTYQEAVSSAPEGDGTSKQVVPIGSQPMLGEQPA